MKKKNVKTNTSYEKYQLRGAIKEIMRNYGLRTISLANYNKWLGTTTVEGVHSVRYDIMNGYIHMHEFNSNGMILWELMYIRKYMIQFLTFSRRRMIFQVRLREIFW